MQVEQFSKDQLFLDKKTNTVWSLVDITETKSLLTKNANSVLLVVLINDKQQLKRVPFVQFTSNFMQMQSKLVDQVLYLNRLLED